MSINQRIIDLEKNANEKGISSFAKYIGVPPTTFSNIVGGRFSEPKHGVLAKILKAFPELNPNWLMLGEGEMWLSSDTETPNADRIESRVAKIEGQLELLYKTLLNKENENETQKPTN